MGLFHPLLTTDRLHSSVNPRLRHHSHSNQSRFFYSTSPAGEIKRESEKEEETKRGLEGGKEGSRVREREGGGDMLIVDVGGNDLISLEAWGWWWGVPDPILRGSLPSLVSAGLTVWIMKSAKLLAAVCHSAPAKPHHSSPWTKRSPRPTSLSSPVWQPFI